MLLPRHDSPAGRWGDICCLLASPVWDGSLVPCWNLLLPLRLIIVSGLRLLHQMRPVLILDLIGFVRFLNSSSSVVHGPSLSPPCPLNRCSFYSPYVNSGAGEAQTHRALERRESVFYLITIQNLMCFYDLLNSLQLHNTNKF